MALLGVRCRQTDSHLHVTDHTRKASVLLHVTNGKQPSRGRTVGGHASTKFAAGALRTLHLEPSSFTSTGVGRSEESDNME